MDLKNFNGGSFSFLNITNVNILVLKVDNRLSGLLNCIHILTFFGVFKNINVTFLRCLNCCAKITAIRSFGHGLHTDCSTQVDSAFHPPRDGK